MTHLHFFQVKASDNYSLGLQLGEIFRKEAQEILERRRAENNWLTKVDNAQKFYAVTQKYFPNYIEELEGYAKAAGVDLKELWS